MDHQDEDRPMELQVAALAYLTTIRTWAMFLAVLGFIASGFLVLFGLLFAVLMNVIEELQDWGAITGAFGAFFYVGIGVAYFFPSYYLYKFSDRTKHALLNGDSGTLTAALGYLKSHYVFIGVAAIVMIGLYILIILGVIIFSIAAGVSGEQY